MPQLSRLSVFQPFASCLARRARPLHGLQREVCPVCNYDLRAEDEPLPGVRLVGFARVTLRAIVKGKSWSAQQTYGRKRKIGRRDPNVRGGDDAQCPVGTQAKDRATRPNCQRWWRRADRRGRRREIGRRDPISAVVTTRRPVGERRPRDRATRPIVSGGGGAQSRRVRCADHERRSRTNPLLLAALQRPERQQAMVGSAPRDSARRRGPPREAGGAAMSRSAP